MIIRPMELMDIDQVVKLENQIWNSRNTPAPLPISSKKSLLKRFEEDRHYLLAEDAGIILGVLDYQPYYPFPSGKHVVTFSISVRPDVRGQGIGRQLFEAFCQAIRRDQYKKILLHVLSSNPEACLFYEKLGFKEEAVLKNQFYLNGHSVDDLIYSYYLEDNHAT